MLAVPQVGSKLARSACGTKRKVRAVPCASAGAARRGETASAAAPAADVRNLRRFMAFPWPRPVPDIPAYGRDAGCAMGKSARVAAGTMLPLYHAGQKTTRA